MRKRKPKGIPSLKRERGIARDQAARESKRAVKVDAARDSVLDSLDEEVEKLSWAQERDLLERLAQDIELRQSDNNYRRPKGSRL